MRRITIALMSTISGLVLLFSYHTSTGQGSVAGTLDSTTSGSGTSNAAGGSGSSSSSDSSGSDSGTTTLTGDSVQTRWGAVQVRITVKAGRIVSSEAIAYPNNNGHDVQINAYAVPVLNQQAVDAQGADLDGVSGATVTSEGYRRSLQSALDQAKLG
jgi:uncharacterized protein with FMN-binding domain